MVRELFLFIMCTSVWLSCAGTCPEYPLIRDFEFEKYLGMWYQQDKQQSGWEMPGRCWKAFYLRDPKNGQFKMRMIFENTITRREEKYDSQLSLQTPLEPSVIKYTIPLTFLEDEFQVLATDYTTFSVEYKCDPNGILDKQESVFLLTREQNPSPLVLQKAYAIMHRYGIDIRKLERVDQTCGGMKLIPSKSPSTDPQRYPAEYEYFASPPNQEINSEHSRHFLEDEDREGYDYYDAPPILTAAPTVLVEHRRQPVRRRFKPLRNPFPPENRVQFGASLASRMRSWVKNNF